MNTKYYLTTFLLLILVIPSIKSQITVGKDVSPAKYSILQVEYDPEQYPNGGGVLLPRLDATDIVKLEAKLVGDQQATGLMIFNTSSRKVEYWNGTKWVAVPSEKEPNFNASNGLTAVKDQSAGTATIKLGGDLIQHTEIPLEGNTLQFPQGTNAAFNAITSSTDTEGITTSKTMLTIKNNRVGINTDNPTALLHIKKDDQLGGFRYTDGNQNSSKVLTLADVDGTAEWKDVQQVVKKEGDTYKGTSSTTIGTSDHLMGSITCTEGKWLIIAKVNTSSYSGTDFNFKYTRLKVLDGNGNVLGLSGETTEFAGMQVALPSIAFYKEFDTPTTIRLYVQGKASYTVKTPWPLETNDIGYFHAIQLYDPNKQ